MIFKKGDISFLTIMMIVTIISFGMMLSFFVNTSETVSTTLEDNICRGLIFGKDYSKIPAFDIFLYEITQKCKVEKIIIEEEKSRDEGFEEIAQTMQRCWYRYGNGEKDFLSAWDTTGQWCFECARLEYENSLEIYPYEDLVSWMDINTFENSDGEQMSYLDSLNKVTYSLSDDEYRIEEYQRILNEINLDEDFSNEEKLFLNDLLFSMNQNVNHYKYKSINTNENLFVVYRFDRISRDIFEVLEDSLSTSEEIVTKYGGTAAVIYASRHPIKFSQGVTNIAKNTAPTAENIKTWKTQTKKVLTELKESGRTGLKLTKRAPIIGSIIAGGTFFFDNHNRNYIQYVELMTQEEYYRTCGTERRILE